MHIDVFDRDFLLALLAAVAIERIEENRVGAGQLVRLAEVIAAGLPKLSKALLPVLAVRNSKPLPHGVTMLGTL